MKRLFPNIHQIGLGGVNAFLFESDGLVLIDTGYQNSWPKIHSYLSTIGFSSSDIRQIIVTHLHTDHTGSLAKIKKETGATVYMHVTDAKLLADGKSFRENYEITPGVINKIIHRFMIKNVPKHVEPVKADKHIKDGDLLPIGAGLKAIHVPGHCEGQLALIYEDYGGVLFAADSFGNMFTLSLSPIYEDLEQGKRDLVKLSELNFENAVFGHGRPILGNASKKFRKKFEKNGKMRR